VFRCVLWLTLPAELVLN